MTATEEFVDGAKETFSIMPDVALGIASGVLFMIIPVAILGLGLGLAGKIARNTESAF